MIPTKKCREGKKQTNIFLIITKVTLVIVLALAPILLYPTTSHAAVVLLTVDARQWNSYSGATFYNKTVAQLIHDEAEEHNINPRLIITILQRESSAITGAPSSQTTRAWPLFYNYDERMAACLNGDESSCNDTKYGHNTYRERAIDYGGVGQQIAYATYNFQNKYDNGYSDWNQPITIDGQSITCANKATRILYAYTPHLTAYDTGSNFYLRWVEWWGGTPNGGAYSANNIISDTNFRNSSPMSTDEINNFLKDKGSWLADYTIPEYVSVPYPAVESPPPPPPTYRTGDINQDNRVNLLDLSILAAYWGHNGPSDPRSDINGDGTVNLLDLSLLAANWEG